jgi:isoquinoline 1-oxidoreductase subunit alpha
MIPQEHIGELAAKSIVTCESLDNKDQHPVVQAWIEYQVPQCGYCETRQITQAISLISRISKRTDERIN